MPYVSRVDIIRRRSETMAHCDGCDINPDSTRERVRQHVKQTGHTARVLIEDVTKYEPRQEPRP